MLMRQQAGMDMSNSPTSMVRSVTVWKVESDYVTAKVRERPQPRR